MSEQMTLITARETFGSHTKLVADRVVGISLSGSPTIAEYGRRLTGREDEFCLWLAPGVIDSIAAFYERYRARNTPKSELYDCHYFVNQAFANEPFVGVASSGTFMLEPGFAYGVMRDDECIHSLLGVNDPTKNLSVLGIRAPLALSDNRSTLAAYQGDGIASILP